MKEHNNPLLAIQYHLYEHPLYACCSCSEDSLNVLIIGFGEYGQLFLDASLQGSQIRNKKLNVTVISDDENEKMAYLAERPELPSFFDVDGSLPEYDDNYGRISFESCQLARDDQDANADILQTVMCEQYDMKRPHYVFIALGDDVLDRAAADACRTAVEVFGMSCAITYICEESVPSDEQMSFLYPLYINADIIQIPSFPEVERMAFNTHLVWEKNLNVDYGAVRAGFRKNYNHNSCVSSALLLKYKLYSIGIDLETTGFVEAARRFGGILSDKSNHGLKNELIWIEHRRWVTEKLCLGWQHISNLEECAAGVTKDEKRKRHVCIVRSRPDQKLAAEFRTGDNYDKWDKASDADLGRLADLDRMSVELHRVYAQKAKNAKKQNLLIPFILIYTENAHLVIPFSTGDNSSVFGNVAASTVASPSKILYLYYVENKQSLVELNESIPYVIEYMRKKNFKAAVEFFLLYQEAVAPFVTTEYEKGLIRLGNGRIR